MDDLGEEAGHSADTHSDSLLSGLLECLLDYCTRYYERQFITRGPANEQLMRRYESVLDDYIRAGKLRTHGLPAAEYCSQRLGLSPAYFSDLVEHETGKRPDAYIELKRMQIARQKLLSTKESVQAIAENLGFPSSQLFCSLFKKITGLRPIITGRSANPYIPFETSLQPSERFARQPSSCLGSGTFIGHGMKAPIYMADNR
ncbi:MAG: helix-turn-helix transcriptional regulator [Alistipes ihumii]